MSGYNTGWLVSFGVTKIIVEKIYLSKKTSKKQAVLKKLKH
jgi:hypothetical protein